MVEIQVQNLDLSPAALDYSEQEEQEEERRRLDEIQRRLNEGELDGILLDDEDESSAEEEDDEENWQEMYEALAAEYQMLDFLYKIRGDKLDDAVYAAAVLKEELELQRAAMVEAAEKLRKSETRACESERTQRVIQETYDGLVRDNACMSARLSELERLVASYKATEQQRSEALEQLGRERQQLQESVSDLSSKFDAARHEIAQFTKERVALETQIGIMKLVASTDEQMIRELSRRNEPAESLKLALQTHLDSSQKRLADLEQWKVDLEREKLELVRDLRNRSLGERTNASQPSTKPLGGLNNQK